MTNFLRIASRVALAAGLSFAFVDSAQAIKVLMHGRETEPVFRDDGWVFAHLETLYGADNVDYMQGLVAPADGSAAIGYDVLLLSSTMPSSALRNKYEDSTVGIVDCENALIHNNDVGNFMLADAGGNQDGLKDRQKINILNPSHPLAAGLSGEVTVFQTNVNNWTQMAKGPLLGSGVSLIADAVGPDLDPLGEHAILAAEVGASLLGDGSAGSPATAAGRRVFFFMSDFGFFDFTADGVALLDAAINWAAADPLPLPGDYNNNHIVDAADFTLVQDNMGASITLQNEVVTPGVVTQEDYDEWKARFGNMATGSGAGSGASAAAVPEPASIGLLLICLGILATRRRG